MANKKIVNFNNEIIKQGNSYCIRIPKSIIEYMGFELGGTVKVTLSIPKEEKIPRGLLNIYKKIIRELRDFTDKELDMCFFSFTIENESIKGLNKSEKLRLSKAFEKIIELQKGNKFLKKYQIFKKSTTKKNMLKIIKEIKKSKYSELAKAIEMQIN